MQHVNEDAVPSFPSHWSQLLPSAGAAGLLLLTAVWGCEASAWAQTASATASAFAEGFVPVPGGQPNTENVDASQLVIAAYGAFALGFIGYLFHLARMQTQLAQEVRNLAARIDAGGDKD
ncbi:MAG: hypothetical protein AAFU79_02585 [Myxococcota bacterium]